MRVRKRLKFINNFSAFYFYCSQLNNGIVYSRQSCRLNVKNNICFFFEQTMCGIISNWHAIIHEIRFHPVNHFNSMLFGRRIRIREGLNDSMVSQSDGLMPPFFRLFDKLSNTRNSIHLAHWGMKMQFHSFFSFRC
ncbi:hypothetical protein BN2127_JRS9_03496 [Bacillus subtilis]|nr:hypothetical protein BN2127_JRS11_03725 [Bacillus subtilis]CUB58514.1 hypothetical protein BN2127_JRS9_03496 [Bacillus subtilis]